MKKNDKLKLSTLIEMLRTKNVEIGGKGSITSLDSRKELSLENFWILDIWSEVDLREAVEIDVPCFATTNSEINLGKTELCSANQFFKNKNKFDEIVEVISQEDIDAGKYR